MNLENIKTAMHEGMKRKLRELGSKVQEELRVCEGKLETANQRIRELEQVLQPFSDWAGQLESDWRILPDDTPLVAFTWKRPEVTKVTLGDCRRARAVLMGETGEELT